MNIVITGANGFVGRNLYQELVKEDKYNVIKITRETTDEFLKSSLREADFIFHLAGENRPETEEGFIEGNVNLSEKIIKYTKENPKKPAIVYSSSIQAEKDNPYGQSKNKAEQLFEALRTENGNEVYIYRLNNLFGKWSKPNYNTVVATFCHKIARNEEVQVNDPNVELTLNYIDDVLDEFKRALQGNPTIVDGFGIVLNEHKVKLGYIAELIKQFKQDREDRTLPKLDDDFIKALYSTYLSFLPEDEFSYPLTTHSDHRGSFTEFLKTPDRGQVSVNISKPGITKGQHWHHTKNEKFLVVSGEGVIRFRKPDSDNVIEYFVSGDTLEVVDIPVGYTHNIENLGDTDMVTIMWVNEMFDPEKPDTYYLEV
ncbi:Thermophilic glucose-6-phosphate isomerase and related metalloenzymes [Macrococcoides caseolyticum]|uniref:polysaccharide biosynthesis C-terminal domain-containing protein n=1 Tax=Macrococcoides caseolyticum TaxID=69966 RepID=UPI000E05D388|nr:NAD-dependent epimerase/dehydratase family protein [Macrococcus caseolyticus]STY75984.1 Thermophilic glucose-6-phosphate isomerase and related metalloenzymes [Macrococcus caseolyticus]